MALPPLRSILAYGQANEKSPEETAEAVQRWRKDILDEGRKLAKDDPQLYWEGSSKAEADAQVALTTLNELNRQRKLTELMPDQAERQQFLNALDTSKGNLPDTVPPKWKEIETELVKAGEVPVFQGAKGFDSKIRQGNNELGSYQVRQTPDGDFEALVVPAGGDQKPQLKRFTVDREKLLVEQLPEFESAANVASARLKAKSSKDFTTEPGFLPSSDDSDKEFARIAALQRNEPVEFQRGAGLGSPDFQPGNRPTVVRLAEIDTRFAQAQGRRRFLENANEVQLIDDQLTEFLRKDKDFLKTVPENDVQQYTTRPARQIYADLQNAGTGISDLVTGQTSSGEAARGRQAYIDQEAPGALRSRFETKGEAIGDDVASGVQSLLTLYGPAALLKVTGFGSRIAAAGEVAAPFLRASGLPGAGVAAAAMEAPAAAAGWTNLFATAYGANYAAALQEADALESADPERAKRIRSMAQFSSFANAGLELATEKIPFGDEARVFSGAGATLRQGAAIPFKEGAEEGLGAMAQNTVGTVFDTGREEEDVGKAVKGGFVGGVPFAGVSIATRLANQKSDPVTELVPTPQGVVPKSVVGGEVLSRVPVNTPIKDVVRITENLTDGELTEGEQRRRDLDAVELPVEQDLSGDSAALQTSPTAETQEGSGTAPGIQSGATPEIQPSPEVAESEQQAVAPDAVSTTTPNEEIQNEPEQAEGQSQAAGSLSELALKPTDPPESRAAPNPDYFTGPEEPQRIVDYVNGQKGSKLRVAAPPSTRLARFAEQIASISGRKVVFVKGSSRFDGVQTGDYLVIKTNGKQGLRYLIGHELGHSLEGSDEYQMVSDTLKKRDPEGFKAYSDRLKSGINPYRENEIEREFVADTIGEAVRDRAFWRSLTQEADPTTLQRIYDALLTVLDKVVEFSRDVGNGFKGRPNATKTLADVEAARELIRGFIQQAGPSRTTGIQEAVQESRTQFTKLPKQQADGEGGFLDLYNVTGGPADGTTFSVPSGSTEAEVQTAAEAKTEQFGGMPESRLAPTQKFGILTDETHMVTTMKSLHEIADRFVPVEKVTINDYEEARTTVKQLLRRNGAARTRIEKAVDSQFADRLAKIPKDQRESEANTLKAMVVAVIQANLMRMSLDFYTRPKGEAKNKARAQALRADNLRLGQAGIFQVSSDRHTAARILRATQLDDPSGNLSQIVQDMFDSAKDTLDSKAPGASDAVKQIEDSVSDGFPDAARAAARMAVPGAEEYVRKELRAKSAIRGFVDKWILLRESRSTDAVKDTRTALMAAMDRLETDYDGNVDQVLELLEDAVNRLSPSKLAKAQEELTRLVEMDIRLAENNYDVYGDDRNLSSAAKSFINRQQAPKERQRKQATADLAYLRQDVRDGILTPAEAAQVFVEMGGDPKAQADLEKAFEADAIQKIHQDEVKEEARKARQELKNFVKAQNQRARTEATSNARLGPQELEPSQDVVDAGARAAQEEDFARSVEDQAAAADEAEQKRAASVIKKPGERSKSQSRRSLIERIAQKIQDNPQFDVSSQPDRLEIIKSIMRDENISPEFIDEAATNALKAFEDHLTNLANKTSETLAKQLVKGKLTAETLKRAIRLSIIDPSKPLTESLAAVQGWNGLKPSQFDTIFRMAAQAQNVTEPQAQLALWQEITRIIMASGLPPKWKDVIASSVRASMYGGVASLGLQGFASLNSLVYLPLRRIAERIVTHPLKALNPLELLDNLQEVAVSIAKNLGPSLRSGFLAFWRNAGLALPASQEKENQVGILAVDALVRKMDIAIKRMKDKNLSTHSRILAAFDWFWKGLRQIVWRVYGFFDSFNITMQKRFLTDMQLSDAMRKEGIKGSDAYKAFMDVVDSNILFLRNQGLPQDIAAIEGRYRAEQGWFDWLRERGLKPDEASLNGFREAVSNMGNHAEVQGIVSVVANKVVDISHLVPGGLGPAIFGPTRIPSNITDAMLWHLPGFNIFRISREYMAQREGKRTGKFTGRFNLAARTPYLFRRRMGDVIMSNGMFWPFLSLFLSSAGDDDDPDSWFHYEGAAPTNQAERNEFFGQGRKEYSLSIGKRGERQTRILLTRGVWEFLNFPLAAAKHTAQALKGKKSVDGATLALGTDVARIGLPAAEGFYKVWGTLESEDDARMRKFFADVMSSYLPLSAFSRSVNVAAGVQQSKDDSNYLLGRLIPATVLINRDGALEMRNFLNENPLADTDPINLIARMGLPISIFTENGVQDPTLKEDFTSMNYFPAPVETMKEFKKSYAGREKEVWAANGVENDQQLFQLFVAKRAEKFKAIYEEDPEPGATAKDTRTAQERLEVGDQKAFAERMGAFRAKSTREVKEEMEITTEED